MRPRLLHLGYFLTAFPRAARLSCFNEAEAFTPRIQHDWVESDAWGHSASMRPRLLHLGYKNAAVEHARLIESFNEAEAFTPRIPVSSEGLCLMWDQLQ